MNLIDEYISRRLSLDDLVNELKQFIQKYNQMTGAYLFVYASDPTKPVADFSKMVNMHDYQVIFNLLRGGYGSKLDFYIETPGGSGEAAEEIVRFTRDNFETVRFVVAGEAKSAGTIMVLSGDEIHMTDSGSLGPIDAQMKIGRSQISAHDYMQWVQEKQDEYKDKNQLNPFDATMIAQISPGELYGVDNALQFARDVVVGWLPKYKFGNWDKTETTGKKVTQKMKEARAVEIAETLTDHTRWRSHGRSLKITDLEEIGLKIDRIDDDAKLADIVYRIATIVKMIFMTSSVYKVYITADNKLLQLAEPQKMQMKPRTPQDAEFAEFEVECDKCKKKHRIYALLADIPDAAKKLEQNGAKRLTKDNKVICDDCSNTIDLSKHRVELERNTGKRVL